MGENALPIDVEDRNRAIRIVGSTTRRVANAVGLYLIFALPSLAMGSLFVALEIAEPHPMDPPGTTGQLHQWPQLVSTILAVGVPNLILIWLMFRVQTKTWWRRLVVQLSFRRALQIVVGIRVFSWLFFMFVDGLVGLLAVGMMAIPAQWIFGESISDPSSFGVVIYMLLPVIVITMHLFLWGLLLVIVSAITSGVMNQTTFPCLWCGHEQYPTVGDRCPECGIALSEAEVSRAKSRRIYQPVASAGSATNDLENPTSNA
jgi:hypothetical protein